MVRKVVPQIVVGLIFVAAIYFQWYQFHPKTEIIEGIADEREHYSADLIKSSQRDGAIINRYLADRNVVVGFYGTRAMLMYYSKLPMAIECESGLTDEYLAHRQLEKRGRIGHEKKAPLEYILRRKINFTFKAGQDTLSIIDKIQAISFAGLKANMTIYDRTLMDYLKQFPEIKFIDFPTFLDKFIENFKQEPVEHPEKLLFFFKGYYFDHNPDPERYNRLLEIINRSG